MEIIVQPIPRSSGKRRYRTPEEKRRIVEEKLAPETSVAMVARRHGVNANHVFDWRKLVFTMCDAISHCKPICVKERMRGCRWRTVRPGICSNG